MEAVAVIEPRQKEPLMYVQVIDIEKLVPHEGCATVERLEHCQTHLDNPITVKPIVGTDRFYVSDGTNRLYKAMLSGDKQINCLVGPPDFSERNNRIAEMRIARATIPAEGIELVRDDKERLRVFFSDTEQLSQGVKLSDRKGNMVKVNVTISYPELEDEQFVLPLKGNIGGLILDVNHAIDLFDHSLINESEIRACWGDSKEYAPTTLPSYLEIGVNGRTLWGAGFYSRQAFKSPSAGTSDTAKITKRGKVTKVEVFVLYPNGLTWNGYLPIKEETSLIVWNDKLVACLKDRESIKATYFSHTNWWDNPTTLMFSNTISSACQPIEHSCGSTCIGGGCTVA